MGCSGSKEAGDGTKAMKKRTKSGKTVSPDMDESASMTDAKNIEALLDSGAEDMSSAPPPLDGEPDPAKPADGGRVVVPDGICPGCMKPYDKYSMKVALGNTWHPECFKCPKCGEKVNGSDLFEHDGFPYHEDCYATQFNPMCDACGKVLGEQYIKASGKKLHPECLKCTGCEEELLNKKIFEKESCFYCETCYATKFKEPCAKCKKPIIGEHVEALEQRYHPECLTCETCNEQLSAMEFREFKGRVYCSKHVPQPTRRMLVICSQCGDTDYRKADNVNQTAMDSILCRLCEKDSKRVTPPSV